MTNLPWPWSACGAGRKLTVQAAGEGVEASTIHAFVKKTVPALADLLSHEGGGRSALRLDTPQLTSCRQATGLL